MKYIFHNGKYCIFSCYTKLKVKHPNRNVRTGSIDITQIEQIYRFLDWWQYITHISLWIWSGHSKVIYSIIALAINNTTQPYSNWHCNLIWLDFRPTCTVKLLNYREGNRCAQSAHYPKQADKHKSNPEHIQHKRKHWRTLPVTGNIHPVRNILGNILKWYTVWMEF